MSFAIAAFLATSGTQAAAPLPPERPRDAAPSAPAASLPPYQVKLERLAELLGTLSFLRDLCGVGDGPVWRDKMTSLLGAEGSAAETRDRLAGSYNRGFQDYRLNYRSCTPAAVAVIERSLAEGSTLARELSTRFGS